MPYTYGTGRWIGRASDAETWGRDAMAHEGADGYRDEETTVKRFLWLAEPYAALVWIIVLGFAVLCMLP